MTDETEEKKVVELKELEGPMTAHPVDSPYMVWVNVEGPLVPASAPGKPDGDYFWNHEGYLVLYFELSPGDLVQVLLGDVRQVYRFPEGAPALTKLVQCPIFRRREDPGPQIITPG